jgi:hypothetical protein
LKGLVSWRSLLEKPSPLPWSQYTFLALEALLSISTWGLLQSFEGADSYLSLIWELPELFHLEPASSTEALDHVDSVFL